VGFHGAALPGVKVPGLEGRKLFTAGGAIHGQLLGAWVVGRKWTIPFPVIPRLDRGIQINGLDCPVKPGNDMPFKHAYLIVSICGSFLLPVQTLAQGGPGAVVLDAGVGFGDAEDGGRIGVGEPLHRVKEENFALGRGQGLERPIERGGQRHVRGGALGSGRFGDAPFFGRCVQ